MRIVVSGASSGIGRETARQLAREGHEVIALGRDRERTLAVGREVGRGMVVDFADLASVERVAERILLSGGVDVLLSNAGGVATGVSAQGVDLMHQVNHLAGWVLARRLVEEGTRRVVWTSSAAQWTGWITARDLEGESVRRPAWVSYSTTKLLNAVSAAEMARRGVESVSVHPGIVATHLGRESALWGRAWEWGSRVMTTPEEAATGLVNAALGEVRPGAYYAQGREVRARWEVSDPEVGRRVWEAAERLLRRV